LSLSHLFFISHAIFFQLNKSLRAVSDDTKDKAYQAWLGYYNSCTVLKWEKSTLVKRANLFSASLGLDEPPTLLKRTIAMMGLKNVPGLRSA
jgi:ATP-dependent RNA helicase MSS116